jgi:hypothetical protein
VLLLIDASDTIGRRSTPSQKNHAMASDLRHRLNHLLRQLLPALVFVGVWIASLDGEDGVDHEDAAICPWSQKASLLGRSLEVGVVFLQGDVDVLKGGWGRGRRSDGKAETMGLVGPVVGVLS